VPGCPAYVVGCINLRGDIIAVIDLSAYLGLGRVSDAQDIVVLGSSGNKVGVLIKAVDRLVNANLQQVRAMREGDDHHPLAKNMLKEENDITAILDVPSLLTSKILEVSP
jgi:purine-binding chemotaxis protein CheW